MQKPPQKFKIGERVKDTFSGKIGTISSIVWYEGDTCNKAEWAYSIDSLGWYFIGESELQLLSEREK